jgi:DNA-binding PadR family transcriptional regulator
MNVYSDRLRRRYDPGVPNRARKLTNTERSLTSRIMVLGALARGPGTALEIKARLNDLLPGAGYDRNTAHMSLPALAAEGCARVIEEGAVPSQARYEITEAGMAEIRDWVRRPEPDSAVRDPIHGKAVFARLDDLPILIGYARAKEQHYRAVADKAQAKLLSAERIREKAAPRTREEELSEELWCAVLEDLTRYWEGLATNREKFANNLDEIRERFSQADD